jgi:VWFA-related protein
VWSAGPGGSRPALRTQSQRASLTIKITSPLGRTGITGPVRIVARVTGDPQSTISPVQFYVDGKLIGEDKDGQPFAVEWVDENPFEVREIAVAVQDSHGEVARDSILLRPLDVTESTSVASVLLEPSVADKTGRPVNGLVAKDFRLFEDDVPQALDMAAPDVEPATYTLLIDSSQSMSRRMDFVIDAARQLPSRLRGNDQVIVAPFRSELGVVTGPTQDRDTITGAIEAIQASGGTAILDAVTAITRQLRAIDSRHIVVLITDGYDENSESSFDLAVENIRASKATVYVIAIGGVAGVSLRGETLLKRLAAETGGKAFFPARDFQLSEVHGLIAADVQQRYLITYTPTNQKMDGTWRTIRLETYDPTHVVRVRAGYFAPAPPPIRPSLELAIRDVNRQHVDVGMEDLVVVEDGVEQTVEAFQEALAPVSIVMVLDSSGSMRKDAPALLAAARSFVSAVRPQDSLGVMMFADRPILVHDLTTKREASLEAIEQYQAIGGTALYDALAESLERLKRVEGRRVVVVMTDGRDENNPGTAPGSVRTFDQVLGVLKEADATVYAIGLGPKVDREPLERVAKASGGEAYFPVEVASMAAEFQRVLEDLRRRYVISYTSTNPMRDGAWRKVEITARRDGIVIESKGGYFAPAK